MNSFTTPLTLLQPARLVVGTGCSANVAADLKARGCRRVALVTSERTAALALPLLNALQAQGTDVQRITGIPAEPTVADLEKAREQLRGASLDAVVGCGGGSVLDVAKLLAGLHGRPEAVGTYFGNGLLQARNVALVCLPTTSGSGSEVSPNAILLDEAASAKKGVISPHLVPDAAYVDPALTASMPPALTAATGMDALVHCIEAFVNLKAHPVVDMYALRGIELISAHLAWAVHHGQDLEARSAVAIGSLYGGLCLGPVNTAAVHALAYPLGSMYRVAHGLANALLLPHVLRFNLPAAPERYARVALALGVTPANGDVLATAEAGIRRLETLAAECGLPRGLRAIGLTPDAIPTLVAGGLQITRLLQNNVRPVTAANATSIFLSAFQ